MICSVVGARPNFMKMAPIIHEIKQRNIEHIFVHTGQHYDDAMSAVFFDELNMPKPDMYFGVGSGSHAEQTARIMMAFEQVCLKDRPHLVIVSGDVNSTLACALVAAKLQIPVAHVEAGLRSFDRSMPEEINRILTDHLSDLLFTTEPSGTQNLLQEGIPANKIHFVGNCMIDSVRSHLDAALASKPWDSFGMQAKEYGIVTLHRPATVDNPALLDEVRSSLREVGGVLPLLFPVHPRTRHRIDELKQDWTPIRLIEPIGYLDFLGLMAQARIILTDSGGIQEESTALGVPCITLRENTERPITVEVGTNQLVGTDYNRILTAVIKVLNCIEEEPHQPELWDGHASRRIVQIIQEWLNR